MIRNVPLGPLNEKTKQIPTIRSKDPEKFEKTYNKVKSKKIIEYF
jgi:hypothetical protein